MNSACGINSGVPSFPSTGKISGRRRRLWPKAKVLNSTGTDVTGIITLPEGTEMCMPGDNVVMSVELLTAVAMEEGLRFAIREGGRTVGSGVVSKIIE